jgi:hypothetical protein
MQRLLSLQKSYHYTSLDNDDQLRLLSLALMEQTETTRLWCGYPSVGEEHDLGKE